MNKLLIIWLALLFITCKKDEKLPEKKSQWNKFEISGKDLIPLINADNDSSFIYLQSMNEYYKLKENEKKEDVFNYNSNSKDFKFNKSYFFYIDLAENNIKIFKNSDFGLIKTINTNDLKYNGWNIEKVEINSNDKLLVLLKKKNVANVFSLAFVDLNNNTVINPLSVDSFYCYKVIISKFNSIFKVTSIFSFNQSEIKINNEGKILAQKTINNLFEDDYQPMFIDNNFTYYIKDKIIYKSDELQISFQFDKYYPTRLDLVNKLYFILNGRYFIVDSKNQLYQILFNENGFYNLYKIDTEELNGLTLINIFYFRNNVYLCTNKGVYYRNWDELTIK